MPMRLFSNVSGCGLLLVALTAACTPHGQAQDPSNVAQGKAFSSGNAEYDAFFSSVQRLQKELDGAPQQLSEAESKFGPPPPGGASPAALAQQVKIELDHMASRGVSVRADLRGPRASLSALNKSRPADTKRVAELNDGVARELEIASHMQGLRSELDSLCGDALRLEQKLDDSFSPLGQRQEVLANLHDAERVLTLLRGRVDVTQKQSEGFVIALAQTLGVPGPTPRSADTRIARASGASTAPASNAAAPASGSAPPAHISERGATAKPDSASDTVTRAEFEP